MLCAPDFVGFGLVAAKDIVGSAVAATATPPAKRSFRRDVSIENAFDCSFMISAPADLSFLMPCRCCADGGHLFVDEISVGEFGRENELSVVN
ncbi:hypothetical protein TH9_07380 [Thalassospira xiamenensis]|nr:hypothetical protein TH9_07380 [Thalassospira xiamenensis]